MMNTRFNRVGLLLCSGRLVVNGVACRQYAKETEDVHCRTSSSRRSFQEVALYYQLAFSEPISCCFPAAMLMYLRRR